MALIKGGFLRIFQTFLYLLAFACAAIILGIYSYFLSVLADRDILIRTWTKAVEGLSGAATLYTIFAILLTCCLGGIPAFAFLAIVLDVAFVGAMVAIAILTRDGAHSCKGIVNTPFGRGPAVDKGQGFGGDFGFDSNDTTTYAVSQRTACRLNQVAFAVSIIGAFLFLLTAAVQVLLVRHHKKEKRYGPSPSNNYTSGSSKRKFWQRKPKATPHDTEMSPAGVAAVNGRPSYETSTTVGNNAGFGKDNIDPTTYGNTSYAPTAAGYHTQPQGTAANY